MFLLLYLWACDDWARRDNHAKTSQILQDFCLWRVAINYYISSPRQMYLPSVSGMKYIVPCLTNIRQSLKRFNRLAVYHTVPSIRYNTYSIRF
jgi:hypothetical protein